MNELIAHIEALNAKAAAWMAEGEGRWAGMLATDAAHWAEYGIFTVADFQEYQDLCDAKEARKAAMYYGWDFEAEEAYWAEQDRQAAEAAAVAAVGEVFDRHYIPAKFCLGWV